MSVSNWFDTFNKNLWMSDKTIQTIARRYKRITRQLNKDFWGIDNETLHSLYVGSYGRDTEIHTSDIDMIMELPLSVYTQYNNYLGNGQSALLQAVKTSIERTYNPTYKKADGQVIQIFFNDNINFEIVPVFPYNGIYMFPDTNGGGSWRTTNPRAEIAAINKANAEWNKNLKRLCRMARAWKDTWDVPMGGLLIDTLAHRFLSSYEYNKGSYVYYGWMSRDFFEYLSNEDQEKEYWLAVGSSQRVYSKGSFKYKAMRAYKISCEAIENEHYSTKSKSKWREIYGTKFPS